MSATPFIYRILPEAREYDYRLYKRDQQKSVRRWLFWGGLLETVAWIPFFLVTDRLLHEELQYELLFLRLALCLTGIILIIASLIPRLSRYSFFWANLGIAAFLQLAAVVTTLVGNNPLYVGGFMLTLVITMAFPLPLAHSLLQISLAIATYLITALAVFNIDLMTAQNQYSLYNIIFAYALTAVMLYVKERQRLRNFGRKKNLENVQAEFRERNMQMELDLSIAQEIQANLLPRELPRNDSLEVEGLYNSMEQVSGDFYEIHRLSDITGNRDDYRRFIIFIADASGHGVSAALISAMAQHSFRHALLNDLREPREILEYINGDITPYLLAEHYLTGFILILDFQDGVITYSNASHRPVLLRQPDDRMVRLDTRGRMIGMFEEHDFHQDTIHMEEGQLLFFYTDGIVEARNNRGEEYGTPRLERALGNMRSENIKAMLEAIYQDGLRFMDGHPTRDDITLLLVRIKSTRMEEPRTPFEDRRSGRERRLDERGPAGDPNLVVKTDWGNTGGGSRLKQLLRDQNWDEAVVYIKDRLSANPHSSRLWTSLAVVQEKQGQTEKALASMTIAMQNKENELKELRTRVSRLEEML